MKLLGNAVVPAQARQALVSPLQKLSQRSFRWPWMAEGLGAQEPVRCPQERVLLGERLERRGDMDLRLDLPRRDPGPQSFPSWRESSGGGG